MTTIKTDTIYVHRFGGLVVQPTKVADHEIKFKVKRSYGFDLKEFTMDAELFRLHYHISPTQE